MFQCLANINNFIYENLFCGKKRRRVPSSLDYQFRLFSKGNFKNYLHIIDIADNDSDVEMVSCKLNLSKNIHLLPKNEMIEEYPNEISIPKMYVKFNTFCKSKNDFKNFPYLKYESFHKIMVIIKDKWAFINNSQITNIPSPEVEVFENLSLVSLKCLAMGNPINDEVVNAYINLINSRKQGNKSIYLRSKNQNYFICNSYFYEYLEIDKEENYSKLIKGLIKSKKNLKTFKRILMPVFSRKRKEWLLVSVDLKNKHILLYNSHMPEDQLTYLIEEANIINNISSFFNYYLDNKIYDLTKEENFFSKVKVEPKKNNNMHKSFTSDLSTQYISTKTITSSSNTVEDFNSESDNSFDSEMNEIWEKLNLQEDDNSIWHFSKASNPIQKNENDGGVFMCKFIDYLSRDEPITFTNEDIEYFRITMSIELLESDFNSY